MNITTMLPYRVSLGPGPANCAHLERGLYEVRQTVRKQYAEKVRQTAHQGNNINFHSKRAYHVTCRSISLASDSSSATPKTPYGPPFPYFFSNSTLSGVVDNECSNVEV